MLQLTCGTINVQKNLKDNELSCLLSNLSFLLGSALLFHFLGLTARYSVKFSFVLLHFQLQRFLKLLPLSFLFKSHMAKIVK